MTSGYMNCPKCKSRFQYADYVNGKWTEFPEPWDCPNCKSIIVVDHEKGYGLKVKEEVRNDK